MGDEEIQKPKFQLQKGILMTEVSLQTEQVYSSRMKRVFSGIQPTGDVHIGNYMGAIRNYIALGNQFGRDAVYCIVDQHAITIPHDSRLLAQRSFDLALVLMAAGLDPNRAILFLQSHVPEHTELGWIFMTQTPLGDLERMTQFKDKSEQHSVLAGLLMYPVLQAADILLYKADTVPVGEDQVQHIELTREVARRFNYRFASEENPIFPEPKSVVPKDAARVPGLDGAGKMSKSKENTLDLLESRDSIWDKIRVAPTDPARVRRTDPGEPERCTIYSYHKLFSSPDLQATVATECRRAGIGCVECKKFLMNGLMDTLEPIQTRAAYLQDHPSEVTDALVSGAEAAGTIAKQTMLEVRDAIGFLRPDSKVVARSVKE
jgi:tryptophanyl-tRNA synthetase